MPERPRKIEHAKIPESLDVMRHSASHVLAVAVHRLYPDTKFATGPTTNNGFYYDFRFTNPLSSNDLGAIEKEMEKIKGEALPFKKTEVALDEAQRMMLANDQPYKAALIDIIKTKGNTTVVDNAKSSPELQEIPDTVSLYQTGDEFVDLCRGPHVDNTSQIGVFKLDTLAAAHWRDSKGDPELTRIYGFGFENQEALDQFLEKRKLASERDHRKLGRELGLFTISEKVGPGLTLWLPNGAIVRREIEQLIYREQVKRGYQHVYSPHIGAKKLWEQSGHWDLYREKMYAPMKVENEEYLVKPMTCPIHCQMYAFEPRSYRDLPVRIGEVASVYRYEQSGELHGLMRVRAFTQDDAHLFMRPDQVVPEFIDVFNLTRLLLGKLGFNDYRIRIGVRSDTEKYLGNDDTWMEAEKQIKAAVDKTGVDYTIDAGDAAFYGPKADFLLTDALGREWQCGTVQVDFMLPERFDLTYTDKDGTEKRPVMIHRAPLGSLERFIAIMVENNGGAFPTWLAPVQTKVIPVTERHLEYAKTVAGHLQSKGVRAALEDREGTVGKKVRDAEKKKVPYILVVGDNEIGSETVSVRTRGHRESTQMEIERFTAEITQEIEEQSK